jgi:hypothetical protein
MDDDDDEIDRFGTDFSKIKTNKCVASALYFEYVKIGFMNECFFNALPQVMQVWIVVLFIILDQFHFVNPTKCVFEVTASVSNRDFLLFRNKIRAYNIKLGNEDPCEPKYVAMYECIRQLVLLGVSKQLMKPQNQLQYDCEFDWHTVYTLWRYYAWWTSMADDFVWRLFQIIWMLYDHGPYRHFHKACKTKLIITQLLEHVMQRSNDAAEFIRLFESWQSLVERTIYLFFI